MERLSEFAAKFPTPPPALAAFGRLLRDSARDLAPIVAVVAFFQIVVLRQPFPDFANVVFGLVAVLFGLALFIRGLEIGLFPIGESMAGAFAAKGSALWLLAFAFALGFGTTVAEPALIAVAGEAGAGKAAAGDRGGGEEAKAQNARGQRDTGAGSVGGALI
ncbi:MAG: DUF1538 family protein, partial [Pseudomonadota bacterium]